MRAALLVLCGILLAGCAVPLTTPEQEASRASFPGLRIETDLGAVTAILFENETPRTAAFMRELVEAKYYDGRAFGRVIPGFVIQEVDRTGGTTDQKETVPLEAPTRVAFSAGAFGIARGADPDSGGSEFFVMDFAYSTLYGNFTAFAQVVSGMDVVHAIARVPAVRTGPLPLGAAVPMVGEVAVHDRVPVEPVVMRSVTLVTVELPPSDAARYPLRVGETTRGESHRATLEWPANLRAGATSDLTWYVWTRDAGPASSVKDPEPMDLSGARVLVRGPAAAEVDANEDANVPGVLRFAWAPPAAGEYDLRLVKSGAEMGTARIVVP